MNIYHYLKNKSKLLRKRPLYRLKIALNYYFSKTLKEPTFIIATRRTGSNLLLSYLNSVPNVSFASEILNKGMHYGIRPHFISKRAVLRHILHSIYNCPQVICGAKLIRIHMETHHITLEDLKKIFPEAKFIVLYRKSLLDQFVSLKIAEIANAWQWTARFRLPDPIHLDLKEFERFCKTTRVFYEEMLQRDWLKDRAIVISYEELVSAPQELFDGRIFPFLGLQPSSVSAQTRKQNIKSLHEIVQNYQEIERFVHDPLTNQGYQIKSGLPGRSSARFK